MRAARYHGPHDVRIEEVKPASMEPTDIRIEITAAGICGSDLHEYAGGPITIPTDPHPVTGATMPVTMGHEFAGRVLESGPDVDIAAGTDVVVNPIIWCGTCRTCAEGTYRLCPNGGFIGLSGGGGGFAEEVVVPGESVIPLPDNVPDAHGAMVEPFAVGLHAIREAGVGPRDSVAIFGAGPIGLTVVQAAKAAGAGPIVVSEPRDARRALAKQCGADVVIDPGNTAPTEHILAHSDGGVDVSFEVAGVEATVNQSIAVTRPRGTITIVSLFEEPLNVDLLPIVLGEQRVIGTAAYQAGPLADTEFGATLEYFADGTFNPEPLLSERIALEDIVEDGFERLLDAESDAIKILVTP